MKFPGRASGIHVDAAAECIWREGERLTVPPKAFLVLRCLMAQAGELVTKQQLMTAAWPDAFVGDVVLNVAIRQLREALGDDAKRPRFIETVPVAAFAGSVMRSRPSSRSAGRRRSAQPDPTSSGVPRPLVAPLRN